MKHILAILILFATSSAFAQKIYTRNDSIPITQDSVTIKAGPFRGNIQWQKSLDKKNWINLAGKTSDSLKVETSIEAMYRAVITDGTCLPVYSDTANLVFTVPVVLTSIAKEITDNSALMGGNVIINGGDLLCERGICYSISQNPTIANTKVIIGSGTGSFTNTVSGLFPNTTYYVRAYSTNSAGTGYGNEVTFKTTRDAYICGTDTIVLYVENYDKGVVEWQESLDTVNWVTIPETVGETYKFLPIQSKYYRSVIKTSTSDPKPSAITFVQLPPIANAGSDKVVGGKITTLLGNQLVGTTGEWLVLSGDSGVVSEPKNPYSQFSGIYNQNYKLKWTVTNLCGQSTDTVNIQFEEIKPKNNFIVVDNTDSILSDSTEMASGKYRIKFSDPKISPYDSVILIGMRDSLSFLRKVTSFILQDSIYSFTTEQGTFEDLFKSGTINIGDAINQGILEDNTTLKSSKINGINPYPTRQTLKEYANNTEVFLLYSGDNYGGNRLKSANTDNSSDKVISISIPPKEIFELFDGSLKVSLEDFVFELTPNFVSQFSVWPFNFKYGMDNAILKLDYTTKFEATKAINFIEKEKAITHTYKQLIVVAVPNPLMLGVPTPIPVTLNITLKASCDIGIEAGITVTKKDNYTNNFTATIEAKGIQLPDFKLMANESSTTSIETASTLNGGVHAKLEIGPEISFMIFDIVGPYVKTPVKMELDLKVNTDLNWSGETSIGLFGKIGAKIEGDLFYKSYSLFNRGWDLWGDALSYKFKWPNKLELQSGDKQTGQAGQVLPNPISFKVTDSFGAGVPFVPVRFELESGNGSIQKTVLSTDIFGKVNLNWTLGSNTLSKLKAFVLDYENIDIENSPIYVTAYSSGVSNTCANSNLAISLKAAQTYQYPSVTGGVAPYTYSINGIDYSSKVPQFNNSTPGIFKIYVKDKNQCSVVRSFTINVPSPCANSDLTMDISTLSKTVQIAGKKGTAPYLYSIDNQTSFSTNNMFSNLTSGIHTVFVKDSKQCISSGEVKIDSETTAAIKASYPLNGASFVPTTNLTFNWLAANYATNQVYDLSLKKGSEAYSLIASNLSATSYTYNTALTNSSNYTWKLAVKGSNSVVIDYSEFTFSTASGNSTIPIAPTLLQPANGSYNPGLPITLSWNLQVGDFNYDLYLDEINASKLIANNLSNNEFAVNNLTIGKKYYWKVRIKNRSTGEYKESAVWNFTPQQSTTGTVTTNPITAITQTTATSGGNITSDGGAAVTSRGVCWSTSQNPTTASSKTTNASGTGSFTSNLTGLTANTTYYVWAYAINSAGTGYGNEISFTTKAVVETGTVTDIDGNIYHTVTIGTQVWMAENLKTTKYNDGTNIPNVIDNTTWANLTTPGYCWYNNDASYKNPYGALYNWYTVNTGKLAPTGWHVPSDAEWTTLTTYLGGENVAGGKLKETGTSHWTSPNTGATNEYGFAALPAGYRSLDGTFYQIGYYDYWWSSTEGGTDGAWDRLVGYGFSGVTRNDDLKVYGFSVRCVRDYNVASVVVPTLSTSSVSSITQTSATSGGIITSDGGAAITASGICWSTSQDPTTAINYTSDGNSSSFTSNLTGLTANTTYYVWAYATNSAGTGYGNPISFTTTTAIETGTVTDIDGNLYHTVTIGTQVWMVENLKTTKYNDGTSIPNVTDNAAWANLTTPGYCWYNNDASYKNPYGALYNWYTVNTGKLAPTGWHVPTDAEWTTLTTYLTNNGYGYQGSGSDIAKSMAATSGWNSYSNAGTIGNDQASNNSSGFTALPGGYRGEYEVYYNIGNYGYWWSSAESYMAGRAWGRSMSYPNGYVYRSYHGKEDGISVRCVRD